MVEALVTMTAVGLLVELPAGDERRPETLALKIDLDVECAGILARNVGGHGFDLFDRERAGDRVHAHHDGVGAPIAFERFQSFDDIGWLLAVQQRCVHRQSGVAVTCSTLLGENTGAVFTGERTG